MQSKTSYFKGRGSQILNKGVWWKDIISFWPLWTVEFLLLQVITTLPLINQMNIVMREYGTEGSKLEMRRLFHVAVNTGSYMILIAVLAILAAVFVFGYLNHSRSAYMLHSLPISRGTHFMTHFLSGLFMLFMPFAVTYGILWAIGMRYHLGMSVMLFMYLFTTLLVLLFFYSLACVVVMLSGNGIMSLVIYVVLNVLEIGFRVLLGAVAELFLYTNTFDLASGTLDKVCTPILGFIMLFKNKEYIIRISSRGFPGVMGDSIYGIFSAVNVEEEKWGGVTQSLMQADWKSLGFCLLSLVVSAVFMLLAFKLYQKRSLECVGDLVAFSWCKPVFKAVFCACGSLLCVCLFSVLFSGRMANITYENQRFVCVVFMLFGCIISYLTGDMILAKSFSIWKRLSWVQVGIFCVVMIIVLGASYVTNINSQLSTETAEKADYVYLRVGGVTFLYPKEEYSRLGLEKIRQDIVKEGQKLTPADIGRSAGGYSVDDDMSLFVDYQYIMGVTEIYNRVSHSYYVNEAKQEELIKSLKDAINNTDNMAAAVFTEAYESAECMMVEMQKGSGEGTYTIANDDARERVFKAFLKDLQEGKIPVENWDRYSRFEDGGDWIELYFQIEISDVKLKQAGIPEDLWWEYEDNDFVMSVTEEMENTWKEVQGLKKEDLGKVEYEK